MFFSFVVDCLCLCFVSFVIVVDCNKMSSDSKSSSECESSDSDNSGRESSSEDSMMAWEAMLAKIKAKIKKKKKMDDLLEKSRHRTMANQRSGSSVVGAHDDHLNEAEKAIMKASDAS